ncbi:hypothetical protein D9M68_545610 [compost metagenome]
MKAKFADRKDLPTPATGPVNMTMLLADWRSDACSTLRKERRLSMGGALPWLCASSAGTLAFLRRLLRHSLSCISL